MAKKYVEIDAGQWNFFQDHKVESCVSVSVIYFDINLYQFTLFGRQQFSSIESFYSVMS
jgi:hypothetical protein